MQSENTWRLSEAEVAALLQEIRSDDLENTTSAWQSLVTPSERPRRKESRVSDPVNPDHYKSGAIECIDALRSALTPEEFRGYCKGSAMAYLWRLGQKDVPEQEARKASWYVAWLAGRDPRG
jgi:hypothetical protein